MNATTTATGATTGTTTPATKRRRPRVKHLFWVSEAKVASELGVNEVPSICGRAWVASDKQKVVPVHQVEDVDGSRHWQGSYLVGTCGHCRRMCDARLRKGSA